MKIALFVVALSVASISMFLAEQHLPAVLLLISSVLVVNFYYSRNDSVNAFDKAVFITGCDSGFGLQLSKRLDERGFLVFAGCLLPDGEGAQQLNNECSDKLRVVPVDVTDELQVGRAVKSVKENLGEHKLWAIVNNAGVAIFSEIDWYSVNQFQRILDVNVIGVVRVTKAFLPLVINDNGRIINVASLAGRFSIPALAAYSMSKRACTAFTDALRVDMKKFNVKVIIIEPALYKTPMSDFAFMQKQSIKSGSETPREFKNIYGDEHSDVFLQNFDIQTHHANPNIKIIVDSMENAVTSVNPGKRYVPCDSILSATLRTYLPLGISAYLLQDYSPKCQPKQCVSGVSSAAADDDVNIIMHRVSSGIHMSSTSTSYDTKL